MSSSALGESRSDRGNRIRGDTAGTGSDPRPAPESIARRLEAGAERRFGRCLGRFAIGVFVAAVLAGCSTEPKLAPPTPLQSPWGAPRTWAVVPFANESGVSALDTAALADRFVAEVDDVDGLSCVPTNRTIAAMRAAGLRSLRSDADAQQLLRVLQVDGLLVGSITAYNPYRPLQLGVAVQVYTSQRVETHPADLGELTLATGETTRAASVATSGPSSQVSRVYDANNHETLTRLAEYAAGRYVPNSGLRAGVYTASMDSYSRFVAFDVVRTLLQDEEARLKPRPDVVDATTR